MGKMWKWVVLVGLAAGLGFGCAGAGKNLQQAQESFSQARDAGAETKAPYDYYAAENYLQLAEHEFDEVDLKQTTVYAEKSLEFSRQAFEKAGGGAQ